MLHRNQNENFRIEFPHQELTMASGPGKGPSPRATPRPAPSLLRQIKVMLRPFRSLLLVPREIRLIKKFSPAIVMVRPDGALSYSLSCWWTKKPYVEDPDGPIEELAIHHNVSIALIMKYYTFRKRRAPAILAISQECRDLLIAKGVKPSRLYPCPNSANADLFSPTEEQKQALRAKLWGETGTETGIVIGFSGVQASWHGLDSFLDIMDSFLEKNPLVRLLIIGQNTLEGSPVYGRIAPRIAARRIVLTGAIPYEEMPVYLNATDLVIMPYPPSPLFYFSPMKMFEALAMGKAVVAPALGQMERVLSTWPSAFLYDNTDGTNQSMLRQLESAIEYCKNSHNEMQTRARFLRGHTWDKSARMAVTACNDVLARVQSRRMIPVPGEPDSPPVF